MADHLLTILIHCIGLGLNGFGLVYDLLYMRLPGISNYAGRWKYLTFWSTVIQTVYFGFALLIDLFASHTSVSRRQCTKLQRVRDAFLASVVWPVGTFVVLSFWAIYAVDRDLLIPPAIALLIPSWLNHLQHTTVLPLLLAEMGIVCHQYPARKTGIARTLLFGVVYLAWVFWVAFYANIWIYPILGVLGVAGRVLFLAALWVALAGVYVAGEAYSAYVWASSVGLKSN